LILVIYVGLLLGASQLALGSWLPPTSEKGVWFYSGLAALLLGNLLVTPFFTKPVDSISYAVAALIALLAVNTWVPDKYLGFDRFTWLIVCIYLVTILISGVLAIALNASRRQFGQKVSQSLLALCSSLGSARFVFSSLFLFALVTFHRNNQREYLIIGGSWALFVGLQPLEAVAGTIRRWWELWSIKAKTENCGEIVGHQVPGIVLLRRNEDVNIQFGDPLIVRADDGKPGIAIALDYVGFAEGVWLRLLHLNVSSAVRQNILDDFVLQDECRALKVTKDSKEFGEGLQSDRVLKQRTALIGLVAPETDASRLRIELVRSDVTLSEGLLVEAQIGSKVVLYQIINGLTKEEIIQQKNTRGYVRAEAKKIGSWNETNRRFEAVKWVPQPNSPVFLTQTSAAEPSRDMVGHFPGTVYPVSVDPDLLVTHNTAILGILGVGKSFLAIELVERLITAGIKVLCLDLTNQYAHELQPYRSTEGEAEDLKELMKIGPEGKKKFHKNVEEAGSVQAFEELVKDVFTRFLNAENKKSMLRIFNPAQFEVWKQDSKFFKDEPSMATLTPTEITRIFTETALEVLQEQGMTERARCCIVFEEAHSLIPEWNAVASEGDKTATNGTAKAILQGRKYGLGCVVVTQRTANVTKTILNQCNTIFALRVFDSTGMEFLKNYIGEDYAGVLSTLEDRHAVVFGRASSCHDPVLIRLNDRTDFIKMFREKQGEGTEQR
jgi:hypothetical protein